MFKSKRLLFLVFFTSWFSAWAENGPSGFLFIENKGQWHEDIKYKCDIPGGVMLITKNGFEYQFYKNEIGHESRFNTAKKAIQRDRLFVEIKNAKLLKSQTSKPETATYNYFLGNDSTNWKSNVSAFREVYFENVLDKIDIKLFSIGESVKYEFILHPGAKPSQIEMRYDNAHNPILENGSLVLNTSFNQIKEFPPFTFQKKNGARQVIKSAFKVENNQVSFEIGDYDDTQDLTIDPELVFSTISGSVSDNWAQTATYDSKGGLFAGGTVFGSTFPITPDAYQPISNGASSNVFEGTYTEVVIQKYDTEGALVYSTFLGGEASEVPHSMMANSRDELVIFGTTSSPNFPTTGRAYNRVFNGGASLFGLPITTSIDFANGTDIFVTIMSEKGDKLVGSTLLGGDKNDGIHNNEALKIKNYGDEFRGEVYVGPDDKIYLASTTLSDDFPIVKGEKHQRSNDAIACRFSNDLSRLEWSTSIGGAFYDAAYGIRANEAGEVYVVGSTISENLSTNGVYQSSIQGEMDGFVAKFVNDQLVALTYIGTKEEDLAMFIDIDDDNQIYVFGLSLGAYPISSGVYRNQNSGQFIHCLDSNLRNTIFSTVFGSGREIGKVDIVPTAFLVNKCGNIYVAGWGGKVNATNGFNENSTTNGLPVSQDAFKKETNGSNFYMAIFEAGAKSLLYGTYFGSEDPPIPELGRGDHLDGGTCRFDKNGVIYHSACVCKARDEIGTVVFPTNNANNNQVRSDNCNMAAFKFDISSLNADFDFIDGESINPEIVCNTTELRLKNESVGALTYEWSIDGSPISRLENLDYTFPEGGVFEVQIKAFNLQNCSAVDSFARTIEVIPFPTKVSSDTTVCPGGTVTFTAEGGNQYTWTLASAFTQIATNSISFEPQETETIIVEISNDLCSAKRKIVAEVSNEKEDFVTTDDLEICSGQEVTLQAFGNAKQYIWNGDGVDNIDAQKVTVAPVKSTSYQVQGFFDDGCKPTKMINITIDESYKPVFGYQFEYECGKQPQLVFDLLQNEKVLYYTWNMGNGDSLVAIIPANYTYNSPGEYEVTVKAKNSIGCELSSAILLNIPNGDGMIPNAISPNGDGKNETFNIGIENATLRIYNRWGKLLYENLDYMNDWGANVNPDVYFYEIILENNKTCKGWIEVFN